MKSGTQKVHLFILKKDGNILPVCSASITGSDSSILNFAVTETYGRYIISADEKSGDINNIVYIDSDTKTTENITTDEVITATENKTVNIISGDTETDYNAYDEDYEYSYADENENDTEYSDESSTSGRIYSNGSSTEQDKYLTDPVPEGKPMPVEPEDAKIDQSKR